jgi:hypothetical protein
MTEPVVNREGVREKGVRYPWSYLVLNALALALVVWALFLDGPNWLGFVAVAIIVVSLFLRPTGFFGRG